MPSLPCSVCLSLVKKRGNKGQFSSHILIFKLEHLLPSYPSQSSFSLSLSLYFSLSIYPSIYLSICLSIYLSLYLSFPLSFPLFLSIFTSIDLSIYLLLFIHVSNLSPGKFAANTQAKKRKKRQPKYVSCISKSVRFDNLKPTLLCFES